MSTVARCRDGTPKIFKFIPCSVTMITGGSGMGKSMLAMWLAWHFIEAGGYVFSNVVVAQLQPGGKWDSTKRPHRYVYVESTAQFFIALSEILVKNPDAQCMLIIDEAATSLDAYDWHSLTAKIIKQSTTLKRKWGELRIVVISMREEFTIKALRQEGGVQDTTLMKDKESIELYGANFLEQRFDPREIVVVSKPELAEPEAYTFTFADQLARIPSLCKPGEFCYSTKATAYWGVGKHPHTEKGEWNWAEFLAIQAGVWGEGDEIAKIIYEYWHENPKVVLDRHKRTVPSVSSEDLVDVIDEGQTVVDAGERGQHAMELLRLRGKEANLSQIARETGLTRERVRQLRVKMYPS